MVVWCKKAEVFCLSASQSCDQAAACGNRVGTAEECKDAAMELLGPNSAVAIIYNEQAPAGCLVDQIRAYFNNQTRAGSEQRHFSFLKSLCRLRNISSSVLPEAKKETIAACGKNRTLPVYRIVAEDLAGAIDELRNNKSFNSPFF